MRLRKWNVLKILLIALALIILILAYRLLSSPIKHEVFVLAPYQGETRELNLTTGDHVLVWLSTQSASRSDITAFHVTDSGNQTIPGTVRRQAGWTPFPSVQLVVQEDGTYTLHVENPEGGDHETVHLHYRVTQLIYGLPIEYLWLCILNATTAFTLVVIGTRLHTRARTRTHIRLSRDKIQHWRCPKCGVKNSISRSNCMECGTILQDQLLPESQERTRTPTNVGTSRLLTMGAIGFLLGFGAWLFWLLLTVSALLPLLLGYDYPRYMSGIFFQNWIYAMVFRSLLSLSLVLESFGCFALKRKYDSNLSLTCGVLFLCIAVILWAPLAVPLSVVPLVWFLSYNPAPLLSVGLLVLGATLHSLRKVLPTPETVEGLALIFIIIFPITLLMLAVVLYWGFEVWLLFLGWLYAFNSVATARFLLRLRTP